MQLHKTYIKATKGFTLIEMIVVTALLGMAALLSVNWGFDVYRTYLSVDEQKKVITELVKERSEVMSGVLKSGIYFGNLLGELDKETTIEIPTESNVKNVTIKINGEIKW